MVVYAVSFYWGSFMVADCNDIWPFHKSCKTMNFYKFIQTFTALVFPAITAGQISSFAPNVAKAKAAAKNIFRIIDRKPAVT